MEVTRIKVFASQYAKDLTNAVNDWIKSNEQEVVITSILHSNSENHMSVVIVYTATEEFFDEIDPN